MGFVFVFHGIRISNFNDEQMSHEIIILISNTSRIEFFFINGPDNMQQWRFG
jgi:hypothetical protein